jgi:hypothetical protein
MKPILFLSDIRSGSTYLQRLLGMQGVEGSWRLPTVEPCEMAFVGGRDIWDRWDSLQDRGHYAWFHHFGQWWGSIDPAKIPAPNQCATWSRWGPNEIRQLPGDGWQIIRLIRDGRDMVSSALQGAASEGYADDLETYFRGHVMAWRNRACVTLECQKELPNYHLFHYEDLIRNPVESVIEMLVRCGVTPETDLVRSRVKMLDGFINHDVYASNSTFHGNEPLLARRWSEWADDRIDFFRQTAGVELIRLGYEAGDEWDRESKGSFKFKHEIEVPPRPSESEMPSFLNGRELESVPSGTSEPATLPAKPQPSSASPVQIPTPPPAPKSTSRKKGRRR